MGYTRSRGLVFQLCISGRTRSVMLLIVSADMRLPNCSSRMSLISLVLLPMAYRPMILSASESAAPVFPCSVFPPNQFKQIISSFIHGTKHQQLFIRNLVFPWRNLLYFLWLFYPVLDKPLPSFPFSRIEIYNKPQKSYPTHEVSL